jgi:glycosyltransferase involved in cell wall biosynthesis
MEPLGESQVFAYLRKLAKDHQITLVSYEKAQDWADKPRRVEMLREVKEAGIRWKPLRYHKCPSVLATSYDLWIGLLVCAYMAVRYRIQIIHARSYVPSVLALALKKLLRARFIFDMRGFWADERIDGGLLSRGSVVYRVAKWFERRFLSEADVVVSLTHAGADAIRAFPYLRQHPPLIEVITTCADLELFHPPSDGSTGRTGGNQPFTLGYVGSTRLWYLFDPVLECFKVLRRLRLDVRLLILNRSEHPYIRERLAAHGIREDWVEMKSLAPAKVADEMRTKIDAGIFFGKPGFQQLGRAPTKLGELLGCGIPCLANAGIGDVERILEGERVGVVLRRFTPEEQETGVRQLLDLASDCEVRKRCAEVARRYFSLDIGVDSYDRIYCSLAAGGRGAC